jgi:hyperosmotically inducible periplasmic protein
MNTIKALLTFSALILTLFINGANAQDQARYKPAKSIEQQVYKKLRGLSNYGVFDFIRAEVRGDTVVLTGKAYSLGTKSDAASAVKDINGVSRVVNNIEQLPPSPFDDRIRQSLLRQLDRGGLSRYLWEHNPDVHIIVENGRVTLEGYVSNKGDRDAMDIYANGVSGVFNVENNLIVGKRAA